MKPLVPAPTAILLHPNEGCLRIAKRLNRRGVPVCFLAPPSAAFFARSRHVDGYLVPPLPEGADAWVERLESLAERGPGILLSGSDSATEFLVRERSRVPAVLRSFEAPGSAHLDLMSKTGSYELARRAGLRVPRIRPVRTMQQIPEAVGAAPFPCIVKPVLGHQGKRAGGHHTRLVEDGDELTAYCAAAIADGIEMLVSEWVPGPETLLEAAVTVRASDGSYALCYARRKWRQWPPDIGVGTLHESTGAPETVRAAKLLLDEAGFEGVSIVEFKRDPRTGEPVLIEANVRIPMGFGLGDACGADASWRLYATLAELPLGPQPRTRDGVKALIPQLDVQAVAAGLREGRFSLPQVIGSYRQVGDFGVLDPRDQAPAFGLLAGKIKAMGSGNRRLP